MIMEPLRGGLWIRDRHVHMVVHEGLGLGSGHGSGDGEHGDGSQDGRDKTWHDDLLNHENHW